MKINKSTVIAKSIAVCALLALGTSTFATQTWDLQGGCGASTTNVSLGSSEACSGAAAGVTLNGFSNGTETSDSPGATNNATNFAAAAIYNWGSSAGLGVVASNESSGATGPHAIDNGYGIDALMISFGTAKVDLSSLTIGWNGNDNGTTSNNNGSTSGGGAVNYNDSDLSVFVWTGAGAPPVTSNSPNTLVASGWALVGNYADVGTMSNNTTGISSSIYSSYWLISAYSTAYGTGTGLDQGNDAFKLMTVAGNTCTGTVTNGSCGSGGGHSNVPEPGSMALMGAAMMGFVATRRRKQKAA